MAQDYTVKVFDQFYNLDLVVSGNEYEVVLSFFNGYVPDETTAKNFTEILFRISNITQIPVMELLQTFQTGNNLEISRTLAYYLNSVSNKSVLYGVNNPIAPNEVVARNIIVEAAQPAAPLLPVADFVGTPLSGVDPLTVQFTDLSSGTPTFWQWDFQNNGSIDSTTQNPIYTYPGPGTYTVKLTVYNSNGNDSETKIDYITVTAPEFNIALSTYDGHPYPEITGTGTTSLFQTLNSSGTRIFSIEDSSGTIVLRQYNLSTPWAIGSAVDSGITLNLTSAIPNPTSIEINSAGTKLYIASTVMPSGNYAGSYNPIFQIDLPTPNSLAGATYTGSKVPFYNANSQIADLGQGVSFGNSGAKLYLSVKWNGVAQRVYQYTLSTPYKIGTAAYDSITSALPYAIAGNGGYTPLFNSTGSTVLISQGGNSTPQALLQYSLPTPWDLSTLAYSGNAVPRIQLGSPIRMAGGNYNNDGTRFFAAEYLAKKINQYNLSTAYRISTATLASQLDVSALGGVGPSNVSFDSTGLKMYVTIDGGQSSTVNVLKNAVYEYTCLSPYTIAGATMSGEPVPNYFWGGTTTTAEDLVFSSDGLNFYITQPTLVRQFTLSTAWLISSAVYSGKTLNVSSQTPNATSLAFNSTGTVLSVMSSPVSGQPATTGTIVNYTLSTPWDLSTATFTGTGLPFANVNPQATQPRDIWFKPDLSIMYVCDGTNDRVYQYTLATPGNLLTASYASVNLDASSQTTLAIGFRLSSDGLTGYILGNNNSTVFQYTLGVAWDLSSAVYSGTSLLVSAVVANPTTIEFDSTGTKLYIGKDSVYTYTLGTAWDISTAVYTSTYSAWPITTSGLTGFRFSSDGLKLFILNSGTGGIGQTLRQYNMTVAYDLTTLVYSNQQFYPWRLETNPSGLYISSDASKIFYSGYGLKYVIMLNMSVPGDLSTALWSGVNYTSVLGLESGTFYNTSIRYNNTGSQLYLYNTGSITPGASPTIQAYSLAANFDPTTMVKSASASMGLSGVGNRYFCFNSTGTRMYRVANITFFFTNNVIFEYSMSTPYDITTLALTGPTFSIFPTGYFGSISYVAMGNGDSNLYLGSTSDFAVEVRLSTPNDLSTAKYTGNGVLPITGFDNSYSGALSTRLSSDGSKIVTAYNATPYLTTTTLTTPWDLSTASTVVQYATNAQTGAAQRGFGISDDGVNLVLTGVDNSVFRYTLATPWVVSTATYTGDTIKQGSLYNIIFGGGYAYNSDGTKLVILDIGNTFQEVRLPTPYQINNLIYRDTGSYIPTYISQPGPITFDASGSSVVIADLLGGNITQNTLSVPYDLDSINNDSIKKLGTIFDGYVVDQTIPIITPFLVYVKPDGSRAWITSSNQIFQVTPAINYDITNTTYGGVNITETGLSVSWLGGLSFSSDGLKMYTIIPNGVVKTRTLGSAWDISTAGAPVSNSFAAQDISMCGGIEFNSTGTKLFLLGIQNKRIYEYTLATPYDISTATYSSIFIQWDNLVVLPSLPAGSLDRTIRFLFTPDGSKLYIWAGNTPVEFNLSTPWDLSTAVYTGRTGYINVGDVPSTNSLGNKIYMANVNSFGLTYITQCEVETPGDYFNYLRPGTNAGVAFDSTGTKFYALRTRGSTNQVAYIWQYTLTTPFDISTAVFLKSTSLNWLPGYSRTTIAPTPSVLWDLRWNTDGSELTLVDSPYIFTLKCTTPYDIGTINWSDSKVFGTNSATDFMALGVNTGIKKIEFDSTGNTLNTYSATTSYTLSNTKQYSITGGDITTLAQVRQSYFVPDLNEYLIENAAITGDGLNMTGSWFADGGTKLYSVNNNALGVSLFETSIPWSLNNLTFSGVSLPIYVAGVNKQPNGVTFSPDGTKMFVGSLGSPASILEYTLSTPWNLTTAALINTLSVAAQVVTPGGTFIENLFVRSDGLRLYVTNGATIWEYVFATPFNLSTATYSGRSYTTTPIGASGIFFDPTGTYMFVVNRVGSRASRFTLSIPWQVNSATYFGDFTDIPFVPRVNLNISFDSTGTILTAIGNSVVQMFLATPWTLSSAYATAAVVDGVIAESMAVDSTGTNVYFAKDTGISNYTATTPGNLNSITYGGYEYSLGLLATDEISVYNGDNNMVMTSANKVRGYTFNTAGQLNTLHFRDLDVYSFAPVSVNRPQSFVFDSTGSTLYIQNWNNGTVYQYNLGVAWDINTLSYSNLTKNVNAQNPRPEDLAFRPDGVKYYMLGNNDAIYQYTLATPGNISTATYDGIVFDFTIGWPGIIRVQSFQWNDDGTKLYALNNDTGIIRQYTAAVAFDISTLAYAGVNLDISSQVTSFATKMCFNDDGQYLIVLDGTTVYQYDLASPWDLSTAVYSGFSNTFPSQDATGYYALRINVGQDNLWLNGKTKLGIFQYNLNT